jgi:hypothetical protein
VPGPGGPLVVEVVLGGLVSRVEAAFVVVGVHGNCNATGGLSYVMFFLIGICGSPGDQIGRIFARWVIVYFGQLLENYRGIPNVWATLLYGYGCA